MKRRLADVAGIAALGCGLFAGQRAYALELGTPATEHPHKSAQHFALELRFSPYRPQIDDDRALTGATPYAANFGTAPRFFISAELDWQTLRIPHLGTLGPGVGIGYVGMSRQATTVTGRASSDETSLSLFPIWGVAVLRADVFYRDLGFPLVPYAKAGLGLARWKSSKSGDVSVTNNVSGRGTSWGTNVAVGLSFALDVLDEGSSRNMDNATGINNTYVFLEAYWLTLDGIAQKNALHIGTNTWSAGLAFEF